MADRAPRRRKATEAGRAGQAEIAQRSSIAPFHYAMEIFTAGVALPGHVRGDRQPFAVAERPGIGIAALPFFASRGAIARAGVNEC